MKKNFFGYSEEITALISYDKISNKNLKVVITELKITEKHISELIRLAVDKGFLKEDPEFDDEREWASVNAWHILAELKATEAIEPLISLLRCDFNQMIEDYLPDFFISFPLKKIRIVLEKYLHQGLLSDYGINVYVNILSEYIRRKTASRRQAMTRLYEIIDDWRFNNPVLNAAVSDALIMFNVLDKFPVIVEAYKNDCLSEEHFEADYFLCEIDCMLENASEKDRKKLRKIKEEIIEFGGKENLLLFQYSDVEYKFENAEGFNIESPLHQRILQYLENAYGAEKMSDIAEDYKRLSRNEAIKAIYANFTVKFKIENKLLGIFIFFEKFQQLLKELKEIPANLPDNDLRNNKQIFTSLCYLTELLDSEKNDFNFVFNIVWIIGARRLEEKQTFQEFKDFEEEFLLFTKSCAESDNIARINGIINDFVNTRDEKNHSLMESFEQYIAMEILLLIYFTLRDIEVTLPHFE